MPCRFATWFNARWTCLRRLIAPFAAVHSPFSLPAACTVRTAGFSAVLPVTFVPAAVSACRHLFLHLPRWSVRSSLRQVGLLEHLPFWFLPRFLPATLPFATPDCLPCFRSCRLYLLGSPPRVPHLDSGSRLLVTHRAAAVRFSLRTRSACSRRRTPADQ